MCLCALCVWYMLSKRERGTETERQSGGETKTEWMNEQMNEWTNEWMNKRTNERINEWMNEWGLMAPQYKMSNVKPIMLKD